MRIAEAVEGWYYCVRYIRIVIDYTLGLNGIGHRVTVQVKSGGSEWDRPPGDRPGEIRFAGGLRGWVGWDTVEIGRISATPLRAQEIGALRRSGPMG